MLPEEVNATVEVVSIDVDSAEDDSGPWLSVTVLVKEGLYD